MDLNKVIIVGRVTADLQLKTTPGGQSVVSVGVATNRTWNDKNNQKQEQTEFHNVVIWGRTAEVAAQFLTKGQMVLIEGRLQTRTWTNKQGAQQRTTEILCERMQLGPRPMGQGGPAGGSSSFGSKPSQGFGGQSAKPSTGGNDLPPMDEVPVINLEEEGDIKPEEIPF